MSTLYPLLYDYLGTNILPDYREFVLVGAEQNTTSATIAIHDVFTQGQEKDDQLQDHVHGAYFQGGIDKMASNSGGEYTVHPNYANTGSATGANTRTGTTTRTKEKAVFWYIKAY